MSKFTSSKVRTLLNYQVQLNSPYRTIRKMEFYEDGILIKTKENIVLNQKHPMRGYSIKDNLSLK